MYQIIIDQHDKPAEIVQHQLCAEDITDVEMMLTSVVSARLGIPNLVLMPMGGHSFMVFQVINLQTTVTVADIEGTG